MSDLYDDDILLWSERQAELLRQHAAAARANDTIDWPNIIGEIEDVGRSEFHAFESLLSQALRHMLKAAAWPLSRDAPVWRADAIDFRQQASRRFVPSMRQKIDLAGLWRQSLRTLPETIVGIPPLPVPNTCPTTLEELLSDGS